jgi:hypothetical protein
LDRDFESFKIGLMLRQAREKNKWHKSIWLRLLIRKGHISHV